MKPINHYWQSINFVSLVLLPVSIIFCLLVIFRRFLYRLGWLNARSSKLPIIVIGNIYIGGNGKTPFVIWLVQALKARGFKPAVVSRGYRADNTGNQQTWPRTVDLDASVSQFGDEPVLIHQATQCPVVVDPVRNRAVELIESSTDCDVIISDDGLQHYAMDRLIEINITDVRRKYGNQLCLPAGPLREGIGRLKSIDYIVYNVSSTDSKEVTVKDVSREFCMDYDVSSLKALTQNESNTIKGAMTLHDFKGKIVHAVAGIGEPDNFFRLLKRSGLDIIEHPFADHYQYQPQDLEFDSQHPIIMTEKDAVKCRRFNLSQCWYLPINARVDEQLLLQLESRLNHFLV